MPAGARPVARVLLLSAYDRLFLIRYENPADGERWWATPGGGVELGEGFREAAGRELHEETGVRAAIGPWVWTRRHLFRWRDRRVDQYERFFVARIDGEPVLTPLQPDDGAIDQRWWRLEEIQGTKEVFAPRRLPELLPPIVRGEYPDPPTDCSV